MGFDPYVKNSTPSSSGFSRALNMWQEVWLSRKNDELRENDRLVTLQRMIQVFITARKQSSGKVMFSDLSVTLFTGGGGGLSQSCFLSRRGSLFRGRVCPEGPVRGRGLCPGGSLSRGVSAKWQGICLGGRLSNGRSCSWNGDQKSRQNSTAVTFLSVKKYAFCSYCQWYLIQDIFKIYTSLLPPFAFSVSMLSIVQDFRSKWNEPEYGLLTIQ